MRHLFIVNPVAGKGKALDYIPEIESCCCGSGEDYVIEVTKRHGHATEIARNYSNTGTDRIYSVGGDGTLNEVLNGMAGSGSSLGIIPSGSGNDFIRSMENYSEPVDIVRRTVFGPESRIDLGRINGRYFINIASIGFDAEVAYNAGKLKRLPGVSGKMAYVMGILSAVVNARSNRIKLCIDGECEDLKSLLVAVANGRYYGGGILPAPEARLDDGLFDICLIREVSIQKILRCFPMMMKGTHGELEEVSFHRGKKIHILCDRAVPMNVDGEIVEGREALIDIIPEGITVIRPEAVNPSDRSKTKQSRVRTAVRQ